MKWWPLLKQSAARKGHLVAIYVAEQAAGPVQSVPAGEAVSDAGLRGDRYGEQRGFWRATDACQVTVITERQLARAKRRASPELRPRLDHGAHRRNLVIGGLSMQQLEGRRFRIGEAIFVHQKPRPPCGHLDEVEGEGLCRALQRNSGACIRVLKGGRLSVGDIVQVL